MNLYWREIYDMKAHTVNNERKLFFSILNQISQSTFVRQREMTSRFIGELLSKMHDVFNQEEAIFLHNNVPMPLIAREKKEHANFLEMLSDIKDNNLISSIEFIDLLKTFIINHIIGTDLECNIYLNSKFINEFISFKVNENILASLIDGDILVNWNSYFETGLNEIDNQHSAFVNILNDLALNHNIYTNETLSNIISELTDYAVIHFNTEEKYILEIKHDYADFNKHIQEHNDFKKSIKEKNKLFNGIRNKEEKDGEELVKEMIDWLITHITGTDKEFADLYIKLKKS